MKRITTILPILALFITSCHREPFADATVDLNPAYVGEYVRFTSYSTNADYIEWDMDDGYTYNDPVVDHYFVDPGNYDVRLSAFGPKGDVSTAIIPMEVIGSSVTITVEDIDNEGTFIPDVEIYLFLSLADWDTGDLDLAIGPFYTDGSGDVTIDGLSYQRYYVDAYVSYGSTGYVNWLLGEDDPYWIETQLLSAGPNIDQYFTAFVEYVTFNKKKAADVDEERKGRVSVSRSDAQLKSTPEDHPLKENKITVGEAGR
jgi:hypothetical protein